MDQTQRQRCVSSFEPLALRPRLHREGFPIHYLVHRGLPPREPPPRRICTIREYRTPLSNTTSQPRGRPVAKQQPIHLTLEGYKPTPPLTRGSKPQPQPLPKREQTTSKGFFTTSGISQPQTSFLFPQNNDPNRVE